MFGSYGKACATPRSDIDLLVDSGLRGLRNRIVHDYEGVNLTLVWDVIEADLPELKEKLKVL